MDNRSDDNLKLKKFKTVTKFKTVKSYGGQNSRLKGSHEDLFLWNQNVLSIFVNQIVFHLSSFE